MTTGRYQVLVVFSPESSSLATVADAMVPMFDSERFVVTVRPAVRACVTDLFAADIIVFGSNDEANYSDGGFADFKESLSGVRLSGRIGAAFSSISNISIRNLDIMLKETGILMVPEPFLIRSSWDDPKTRADVLDWVGLIMRTHEQTVHIH